MNWKIIFQLSIFGLIMAFGTISLIPENIEFVFWLVIFVFCAWGIAMACANRYFLHGFLVSMVNSIWITAVHIVFRVTYAANHPLIASMSKNMPQPLSMHPRWAMAVMGPIFGAIFGIILGLFCVVASKIVQRNSLR